MLDKTILVVSDKFHHFATRKDVITKTELYLLLKTENIALHHKKKVRVIPGQGFSEDTISEILSLSAKAVNASFFDFSLWKNIPKRASKKITHKHNPENILISSPIMTSQNEYLMSILIDENCEMMMDHQTGLHIQGMLLVEAARQAYLATMEKFYMQNTDGQYYFIFNKLTVDYNRFSFPLPSSIKLTNKEVNMSNKKRINTTTKIELIQCKETSASVSMDVTIMPDSRVSNMESRLAKQSLDLYMKNATTNYNQYHQEVEHA